MKQKNLYLLVGVPGSGKTTWVTNKMKEIGGRHISRDVIRFAAIDENDRYFDKEDHVFSEFINQIQEGLDTHENVFADATHLNEKSRTKLLDQLELTNVNIIPVNFDVDLFTCITRNEQRTGRAKVPTSVIRRMYFSHTNPAEDNKYTYAKIITVNSDGKEV